MEQSSVQYVTNTLHYQLEGRAEALDGQIATRSRIHNSSMRYRSQWFETVNLLGVVGSVLATPVGLSL